MSVGDSNLLVDWRVRRSATTWLALISLTLAACGHMPQEATGQAAPSCWRAYAEQIPGVSNSINLCATETHGHVTVYYPKSERQPHPITCDHDGVASVTPEGLLVFSLSRGSCSNGRSPTSFTLTCKRNSEASLDCSDQSARRFEFLVVSGSASVGYSDPGHDRVVLKSIVGLWRYPNRQLWIEVADDGSLFQCRRPPNGRLIISRGRFAPPHSFVWDWFWGIEQIEYLGDLLIIHHEGGLETRSWVRPDGPESQDCRDANDFPREFRGHY
jgi:hypothetical protein